MNRTDTTLTGLTVALVGAGPVARSLAAWIRAAGGSMAVVAGRPSSVGCRRLAEELGADFVELDSLTSVDQELLLLATPSHTLAALAERLAARPQAPTVLHLAGNVGHEVLSPLAARGVDCGSLHPLRAFARPQTDPATATATLFAIDGTSGALGVARRLLDAWGAVAVEVSGDRRALYHLAATLCAGGAVALLSASAAIARHLELDDAVIGGYCELAVNALRAAAGPHPEDHLTGPAARGEAGLSGQLSELRRRLPELAPAAVVSALEILRQVAAADRATDAHRSLASELFRMASAPSFLDPLSPPVVFF